MPDVLLLGDPRLRTRSAEVERVDDAAFAALAATLDAFRREHGFGRAISAPQIGIAQRFIAMNLGKGTFFLVNPVITARSEETFTLWDDCMSFPDLLVRVARNASLSLEYSDEHGKHHEWRDIGRAESELLQHEIDHLDGVLAVDRALDRDSLVMRAEYERDRERYDSLVDYAIVPTIQGVANMSAPT
jgi:peptide deformylase